jgi:hypothetical protein
VGPRAVLDAVVKKKIPVQLKVEFTLGTPCEERGVIALGYGLDDRCSRVRFPEGAGNFSLHHRVQTGSGAYPASYPMGTTGSFPGGKADGA